MKELIRHILREETTDLKKPFMKYEKLINKFVYEVFDEGICGFDWEVMKLLGRGGIAIRIVLYFRKDSYRDFDYERYGQSKQELKVLIEDFLPKFNGIFITYDTTKCDQDTISLNENTDKDLSKKIKLAKGLIYDFFGDEVKSIEQSTYDDKPLLKIYYTTDSKAANHNTWLAERISEVVMEYTGNNLILVPYWTFNWDVRKKLVDIYIGCEELKTHKEEETEGAGGYAAPAFEMKPDHVHFKHLYNESKIPTQIRRRVNTIDRLVNEMLNNMYVEDYENEQQFYDSVIFELGWMVRNEDFGLHDIDWGDVYDYIEEYRKDDIDEYYREHHKGEVNETELTEKCWKGYTQKGMKTMFGKRYPNCVKKKKK